MTVHNKKTLLRNLFLELLSASIWRKPVASPGLFTNLTVNDWKGLLSIASLQGTIALVSDAALSLPKGSLPSLPVIVELVNNVETIRKMNDRHIDKLQEIKEEYEKNDLPFIILKGLGLALNYPEPKLRNTGDIDVFLYRPGDYERSADWIKQKGLKSYPEHDNHKHLPYTWDKIYIENHGDLLFFEREKYNRLMRDMYINRIESGNIPIVSIGGRDIKQLPNDINAFYVFAHMFFHIIHYGCNFKQLTDWVMLLNRHHSEINKAEFVAMAKAFDMLRPMQAFARIAVEHLDAPEEIFPFEINRSYDRLAEQMLNEMFRIDEYGVHNSNKGDKKVWKRRFVQFIRQARHAGRIAELSPAHVLYIPIANVKKSIMRTIKGEKGW